MLQAVSDNISVGAYIYNLRNGSCYIQEYSWMHGEIGKKGGKINLGYIHF